MSLLKINNLSTSFFTDAGEVKAVRGISFEIEQGQTLGLVGESGCGKSVTALSIMGLVPFPGRITQGEVLYQGKDLVKLNQEGIQKIRGGDIAMIFQEPLTSLNPVFTIGEQIVEAVVIHQKVGKKEAMNRAVEMLRHVGISESQKRAKDYPHQLSGGMRQRVMIAMALSCNPNILIADEPTTALDVTIQAQILELIDKLQKEMGMAMLLITHDLGIVAQNVDTIGIMYSGKIVEHAKTDVLLKNPLHPYTQGLLASIPTIGGEKREPLKAIAGTVPSLLNLPAGCSFCDRCPKVEGDCRRCEPELLEVQKEHWVACYHI